MKILQFVLCLLMLFCFAAAIMMALIWEFWPAFGVGCAGVALSGALVAVIAIDARRRRKEQHN